MQVCARQKCLALRLPLSQSSWTDPQHPLASCLVSSKPNLARLHIYCRDACRWIILRHSLLIITGCNQVNVAAIPNRPLYTMHDCSLTHDVHLGWASPGHTPHQTTLGTPHTQHWPFPAASRPAKGQWPPSSLGEASPFPLGYWQSTSSPPSGASHHHHHRRAGPRQTHTAHHWLTAPPH